MSDTRKWVVRTELLLSEEEFNWWDNITYLYDKNWSPTASNTTLPFALFHIVKYNEIKTADLSTKRVILYDPIDGEETQTSGVMQVITDNVVPKPFAYQLELFVPFATIGLNHFSQAQQRDDVLRFLNDIERKPGAVDLSSALYSKQNVEEMKMLNKRIPNLNKDSLDLMVSSGRVLEFRSWLKGVSKYVVVTNMKSSKQPEASSHWRVTLECREVPILSADPTARSFVSTLKVVDKETLNKLGDLLNKPGISKDLLYYQNSGEE